jgi:radical SAM protein with 4Fe4S-binding SPASM domain
VRAGLGRLIISLDGLTQETYEQYRVGGQLDKVLEGTRNLVAAKRELGSHRPFIDLQFIAFQHNLHEVEAVKKLGKELGVDRVSIKTAQVYDFENASGWIPEREDLSRYKKGPGGKYILRHRLFNHCWKLWHSAEITWDGRVLPCCFDKDARYEMGRVPETRFRTIWRSGPYRDFRQKILFSRQKIDICSNCSEGSKVWA